MTSAGEWKARALRGTRVASETVVGPTRDAAVLAVKEFLDERAAELRSKRGPDGYPSVEEVRDALEQIVIGRSQRTMLEAHLEAPDRILTATQLAEAAGYDDYVVANSQYGGLGRALAEEMEWEPAERSDGLPIWTFALATDADHDARKRGIEVTGHWRWQLRPQVAEAYSQVRGGRARLRLNL
ncbi:hypothetical protein FIM10_18660 [Sphingomonadales bacterium 56]|uniref:Uncharacterized protein n=2 Tax=Sphingomonadaceae TaxID=41297 RepID=A0A4Q4ISW3_9SPHN|nr:hypothetical protein [Sphingomonadales bacterium 56]MBY2960753.1 hypothetical protein [Sphingomonadales bacterium 58]RYL96240.1 hypothetical protein EWH08_19835 [Sphingobium indicum]